MEQNELLNDVLIVICRSLLQYAGQAWPWSSDGADALQNAVNELIADQGTRVEILSSFLDSRGYIIDFGVSRTSPICITWPLPSCCRTWSRTSGRL